MLCIVYIYKYAQVFDVCFFFLFFRFATQSSCKFFICYIWYNVRDFCVLCRFQQKKESCVYIFSHGQHWLNEANFVSHVHDFLAYIVSIDFSSIANWSSKTHFSIWPIKCQMDSKSVRVYECVNMYMRYCECECTLETVNEWVSESEFSFLIVWLLTGRLIERCVQLHKYHEVARWPCIHEWNDVWQCAVSTLVARITHTHIHENSSIILSYKWIDASNITENLLFNNESTNKYCKRHHCPIRIEHRPSESIMVNRWSVNAYTTMHSNYTYIHTQWTKTSTILCEREQVIGVRFHLMTMMMIMTTTPSVLVWEK